MNSLSRILIAYDGSSCARDALKDLKRAGLPAKLQAMVVSVADVFLPPSNGYMEYSMPESIVTPISNSWTSAVEQVKHHEALAEEAKKILAKAFPGWKIQTKAFADSPAWGIIKQAKDWKADLIVLGASGLSGTGSVLLGSVSQKVLTEAHCSVRITRGPIDDLKSPVRIVIGIDGSTDSDNALDEALSRRWNKKSAFHLITAVDSRMMSALAAARAPGHKWLQKDDSHDYAWIKRMNQKACEKLSRRKLTATSLLKEGDAKKVLVQESKRWGADCIFLGVRGISGIKHFLLGSVSASIAARAHCSVEIVRR